MSDQLPSRAWAEGPAGDVGANSRAPWGAMPLTPAQLLYRTHGCCPGQEWQGTVYRNEWGDSASGCYPPICEADGSIPAGIRFARGVTATCIPRPPGWDPRWGCWGFSSGTSGNAPPPAGWQPQSISPSPQAGLPAQPQPIPLPQFNGAALTPPEPGDALPAPIQSGVLTLISPIQATPGMFTGFGQAEFMVDASDRERTHKIPGKLGARGSIHFVTVKGTGDVVLRVEGGFDPAIRSATVQTDPPGLADLDPKDRRIIRLKRDQARRVRVTYDAGLPGATGHARTHIEALVWVIWATIKAVRMRGSPHIDPAYSGRVGEHPTGFRIMFAWRFEATIEPQSVIIDRDRPAVEDQTHVPVPGADKLDPHGRRYKGPDWRPGDLDSPVYLSTGANSGWDMSRQIRLRLRNWARATGSELPTAPYYDRLTGEETLAIWEPGTRNGYPVNDAEGNDDAYTTDEKNDPYSRSTWNATPNGLTIPPSPVGQLYAIDEPEFVISVPLITETFRIGDAFFKYAEFREFVRVQLGETWYRVSDFLPWRAHFKAIWGSRSTWEDLRSFSDLENSKW